MRDRAVLAAFLPAFASAAHGGGGGGGVGGGGGGTTCAADSSDYSYAETVDSTTRTIVTNHCPVSYVN